MIDSPTVITEGDGITLDGSGSTGDDIEHGWDLDGDGVADATGAVLSLTWDELSALGIDNDGDYPIDLIVRGAGGRADARVSIRVEDRPSEVDVVTDSEVIAERLLGVTIRVDDPAPDMSDVDIDWGDGSTGTGRVGPDSVLNLDHRYDVPGVYEIRATFTDDNGETRTIVREVTVVHGAPHVIEQDFGDEARVAVSRATDFQIARTEEAPVVSPSSSFGRLVTVGARELLHLGTATSVLGPGLAWLGALGFFLWWRQERYVLSAVTEVRRGRKLAVSGAPGGADTIAWLEWDADEIIATGKHRTHEGRTWSQIITPATATLAPKEAIHGWVPADHLIEMTEETSDTVEA